MGMFRKCKVIGCKSAGRARGYCTKHYQRWRIQGELEPMRLKGRGAREKHPLYRKWCSLRFHRKNKLCQEWQDDFWAFADCVKTKPKGVLRLSFQALDDSKPIGPGNWHWRIPATNGTPKAKRHRDYIREYDRKARREDPFAQKKYHLRWNHGVTQEWYVSTLEKQDNACAICKNPEDKKIQGRVLSLAVDHCHETGEIRGLLCSNCNRGIGHLKHDPKILAAAIDYLTNRA